MPYFVYILRTSSNTLHVGQTNNLEKRLEEHKSKSCRSAKYLRYFTSFTLVYSEKYPTRKEALQREAQLKRLPRPKKEALWQNLLMNKNPIGIFDSGIGGLSVVREIKKILPGESLIYLADKANFPYAEKTPEQIKKISEKNVAWLLGKKAKLIVVACNTATVNAIDYLRKKFPKIFFVGMEPAIKPAAGLSKKGIIILSSPKAAKSKQLNLLIRKYARKARVFNIGSLKLVRAVEQGWDPKKISRVLEDAIPREVLKQTDVLVLGCTHFPLIKNQIQKFTGINMTIIDSGRAVAERAKAVLRENNLLAKETKPNYNFFTTGERNAKLKLQIDL